MTDHLDARLRQLAGAITDEAPPPPPFSHVAREGMPQPRARKRPPSLVIALSVVLAIVGLVAVIATFKGTGTPTASRPSSWKPFCAQLAEIKKTSESPGGWSKGPSDPYGTKAYNADYARLEHISPSAEVATLLAKARPLFNGVVAFTKAVKGAVPSARKLRPIILQQCNLEVGDVFKVGF